MQSSSRESVSLRAVLLAAALVWLANVWILKTELLTGSYATGGTPPAIAVGCLLLLTWWATTWRGRWRLRRSEVLTVYIMLTIAIPMAGYGITRAFLPHLTVLQYFSTPQNHFEELWRDFPAWQKVDEPELIRQCFEGAEDERPPWSAWAAPLSRWALLFTAIFLIVSGVVSVFRQQWVERERLTFPLLYIPQQVCGGESTQAWRLFRQPVFWCGIALAGAHNLTSILHAFNPAAPGLGQSYDLGSLFTERPLDAVRPLRIDHFPQAIGLGYLVSLEVSFSVWFFFVVNKVAAVVGRMAGYEPPGYPFEIEQCAGGYLALGLLLLYSARRHLAAVVKTVMGRRACHDHEEAYTCRGAATVIAIGFAFIIVWCRLSGMAVTLTIVLFGMLALYALVYARIRAEAGVPYSMLYPRDHPKLTLVHALGGERMLAWTGRQGMLAFSSLAWLSRHYYPEFMGAYQIDGLRLADDARLKRSHVARAMLAAMLIGLAAGLWSHLTAYYQYGENVVDGGTGLGDYRARVAVREYEALEQILFRGQPPSGVHTTFTGIGFVITLTLAVLRMNFLRFPLHPLGYLIATAYGAHCPLWASFFIVWLVKSAVLRIGGVSAYRKLIPGFVGLALGHFFFGGVVWGNITPFINNDIARRYWLPRV